jgi:Cu-processing system ATP-binding protein
VLTSHVMSELEELADDIAFLVEGRIRFAGPVHDLKKMTRQLSLERAIAHVLEQGAAA